MLPAAAETASLALASFLIIELPFSTLIKV